MHLMLRTYSLCRSISVIAGEFSPYSVLLSQLKLFERIIVNQSDEVCILILSDTSLTKRGESSSLLKHRPSSISKVTYSTDQHTSYLAP
jgi:hypothetical protein